MRSWELFLNREIFLSFRGPPVLHNDFSCTASINMVHFGFTMLIGAVQFFYCNAGDSHVASLLGMTWLLQHLPIQE